MEEQTPGAVAGRRAGHRLGPDHRVRRQLAVHPSLAAAFARRLGRRARPTDAVSVASLSKQVKIPARSRNILESESIIVNDDASGIVSFQFAIAAAVTGTFSLVGATANFFFAFLGGVLVGEALGLTGNFIVRRVRSWGLENTTFHVLFEVFVPFIVSNTK